MKLINFLYNNLRKQRVACNFMTTYLTKVEDGKTHHFRATVDNNGVGIVNGIFYNWLGKYFEGCGDNISAKKRQKELVDEKLKEGFQIIEFKEILENKVDVYDKAKWHFGGEFPEDLDDFQGYVLDLLCIISTLTPASI